MRPLLRGAPLLRQQQLAARDVDERRKALPTSAQRRSSRPLSVSPAERNCSSASEMRSAASLDAASASSMRAARPSTERSIVETARSRPVTASCVRRSIDSMRWARRVGSLVRDAPPLTDPNRLRHRNLCVAVPNARGRGARGGCCGVCCDVAIARHRHQADQTQAPGSDIRRGSCPDEPQLLALLLALWGQCP
jgi:hypothetical protein